MNLSAKADPIRKTMHWFICCFIAGGIGSQVSTTYLFYYQPNRYHFIYSVFDFGENQSIWVWLPFWIFELIQQHVFWGLAALTGVYTRSFGQLAIHGMKMLR